MRKDRDGWEMPYPNGTVVNLRSASIRLCRMLQSEAIEAERTAPTIVPDKPEPQPQPLYKRLEALRIEADISQQQLADLLEIDIRNVQKHLAGASIPTKRNQFRYQRIFSNLLKREVVILETP